MSFLDCCNVKSNRDPDQQTVPTAPSSRQLRERTYSERCDPQIGISNARPISVQEREGQLEVAKGLSVALPETNSSGLQPLRSVTPSKQDMAIKESGGGPYSAGIVWLIRKGNLICAGFVDGSVAQKCGVWIGDILKSVDGFNVMTKKQQMTDAESTAKAEKTMAEALKNMNGAYGSVCTLQLLRLRPSAAAGSVSSPVPPSSATPLQGMPPSSTLPLYSSNNSAASGPNEAADPHVLTKITCLVQRTCAIEGKRRVAVDRSYLEEQP
mmetsp:Transcript_32931/g.66871  ORF Transcript_32931/g.66871 Transcript_32931/m.66871 type:complete len:268 (-) Transcript_32931:74-877(-)